MDLSAVAHKHHKAEDEHLEAPGQFLRHYSPDIDSYLYNGGEVEDLSQVVMLDFAGLFAAHQSKVKHYKDLSAAGDYVEAIGNIYEDLRWAETKKDARCVLIANFKALEVKATSTEHRDALFDRIFRATSGREI